MSWTKRQLIEQAFDEIGYADYSFDVQPQQYNTALIKLDAMMDRWLLKGIDLSYPIPTNPQDSDLDTDSSITNDAEAVYTNLAVRIAPSLGKTVSIELKAAALESYRTLLIAAATPSAMQLPDTTPKGQGSKYWAWDKDPFLVQTVTSLVGSLTAANFTELGELIIGTGQNTYKLLKNNLDATTAPTVNDDTSLGYEVFSQWIDLSADKAYMCVDETDGAAVWVETTAGAAGGESNTASSVGSGVSVYKQKTGVDLEFNAIKSENSLLAVALDASTNDIELTVSQANINSGVTITASQVSDFDTEVSNNASVAANTAHSSSDGSSHTFIDQSVVSGSAPTFTGTNFTGVPDGALSSGATVVSAGAGDSGKFVKLDASGNVDASTINSADVDHDSTTNFVANEHINHTSVTLTAGTGLTGGGDISSNRTFNVDVGISDDKILQMDQVAGASDNDYAKFTANGLEGRTYSEVKTDLSLDNVENTALSTWGGSSNIVTVGTVTSGNVDAVVTDATTSTKGKASFSSDNFAVSSGAVTIKDGGVNGAELATNTKIRSFGITIDGGGSAITTGVKGYISIPFSGTITQWDIFADQSGSIVVDVWKDTYANFPPTVADTIAAAAKPTLSTAQKNQDATLTGWTTTVTAGDVIGFNVDSASTVTRVTIVIYINID